jgi:hypothetical protein
MLDERGFERALAWYAGEVGEAELLRKRQRFEEANGPIEPSAHDFDQRMAHFWEGVMCDADGDDHAPIARYAAQAGPAYTALAAGWLRSHRSLFIIAALADDVLSVRDGCLGGSFQCGVGPHDHELRVGDRFDARLVPSAGRLWLSPGRVFYPSGTHAALDALLAEVAGVAVAHRALCDALLRMRGSFLRFESMKAEHVFRVEALHAAPDSAAWAIKPSR